MLFIGLIFLAAIILYVIGITQSYKDDYYSGGDLSNTIAGATGLIATAFILIVLYLYIDSYFDSAAYNSQSSVFSSFIDFFSSFVGLKMLFVIYFASFLAAFFITYMIMFLGNDFQEQRAGLLVAAVIYLILLIVIVIGFTVFTKAIASILGIVSTILGILISYKKLTQGDKTGG